MADVDDVMLDTESRMEKSVAALERELASIRTGRASPRLVENMLVDYYGVPTPLNQIAAITVPEARLLMIQPWDKSAMKEVEKSIMKSDLGLMPNSDGNVVRINIPPLTEERRRDLVRLVGPEGRGRPRGGSQHTPLGRGELPDHAARQRTLRGRVSQGAGRSSRAYEPVHRPDGRDEEGQRAGGNGSLTVSASACTSGSPC